MMPYKVTLDWAHAPEVLAAKRLRTKLAFFIECLLLGKIVLTILGLGILRRRKTLQPIHKN
jgi:hypothetical protein